MENCQNAAQNAHVRLIEFKRSPEQFRDCLAKEPRLRACRAELSSAGHVVLAGLEHPKMYVEPHLVALTMKHLRRKGARLSLNSVPVLWQHLKARHVIASDGYYNVVVEAVDGLRKALQIKVLRETVLDFAGAADVFPRRIGRPDAEEHNPSGWITRC